MKKLLLVFATTALTLSYTQAQEASSSSGNENPKNVVKLNLPAIGFGNYSLQYERALGEKISAGLGLRFMPSKSLPSRFTESDSSGMLTAMTIKGFGITPEFRFYPGSKGAPKGFYLAPYLRYGSFTMNTNYSSSYTDSSITPPVSKTSTWPIEGKYTLMGGGLMIGMHWMIKNRVSIDWGILGLHAGTAKLSLDVTSSEFANIPASDQKEMEDDLNDSFGGLPGTATLDVNNSGINIDWKPPFAGGVRSLVAGWLTIGVAF